MADEETKLKEMFRTPNGARRCKDVKKLAEGLELCDGANHPFLESWFYAIHDRLDKLDPTGEECN